jgi:hypothetical protein
MHFKKREELKHKFQGAHHKACSKNLKTRGTSGAAITAVFVNKEAARNLAANRAAIANKRSRKRKKTFAFLRNAQIEGVTTTTSRTNTVKRSIIQEATKKNYRAPTKRPTKYRGSERAFEPSSLQRAALSKQKSMEATMGATKHPSIEVRGHPSDEQRPEASRKSFDVSILEATKYPTPPGNTSIARIFPLVVAIIPYD